MAHLKQDMKRSQLEKVKTEMNAEKKEIQQHILAVCEGRLKIDKCLFCHKKHKVRRSEFVGLP